MVFRSRLWWRGPGRGWTWWVKAGGRLTWGRSRTLREARAQTHAAKVTGF